MHRAIPATSPPKAVRLTILGFCTLFLLWHAPAQPVAAQTSVSGNISSDTTWSAANSPYNLTGDVTIAENVTLTIQPGVVVNGNDHTISVLGKLYAVGTANTQILLNLLHVEAGANSHDAPPFLIEIQFAEIRGGRIMPPTGSGGYGSLILRDSIIRDTQPGHSWPDNNSIDLWYPTSDSYVERNVFYNGYGVNAGMSDDIKVYVHHNVFYGQKGTYAVQNWASYDDSEMVVTGNSFLSTDRVAVQLPAGYSSSKMSAVDNFWNTTDSSIIQSMIDDRNRNPGAASVIPYQPIRTAHHPDTPDFIEIVESDFHLRAITGQSNSLSQGLTIVSSRPWTLAASQSWLGISKNSGEYVETIGIHVKGGILGAGTHTAQLTATTTDGATATIDVTVVVTAEAQPTDIGGEINGVTVWTTAGSPYRLTGEITVPGGAELRIEPGVVVQGNDHRLTVLGKLNATGAPNNQITLRDVRIGGGENEYWQPYTLRLQYAHIEQGEITSSNYGKLDLLDSRIEGLQNQIYLWYPVADSYIERNIFVDSAGISAGLNDVLLSVRNNVFERQRGAGEREFAVELWAIYGHARAVVEHNSFLSTDRIATYYSPDWDCRVWPVRQNYWGTTDPAQIVEMIHDWSEEECGQTVLYEPFLTGPHPDTPVVSGMPPVDSGATINYVSGVINSNTTWSAANSPYILSGDVHVGHAATLTIEPGATVQGDDYAILAYGTVRAAGVPANPVRLLAVDVVAGANSHDAPPFLIEIQFAEVRGGLIMPPTGSGGYGSLILRDSVIRDTKPGHSWPDNNSIYLWYPTSDSYVERNVFYNGYGVNAGIRDVKVYVRHNVFYGQKGTYAVQNWASYDDSEMIVTGNSFLSTDRVAVQLPAGYSSVKMSAVDNFWNTTNTSVIESMIYDQKDDPEVLSEVPYQPFLTAPHPDTPTVLEVSPQSLNLKANAGGVSPEAQNIHILVGSSTIAWTASASAGWLQLSATSGVGPASLSAQIDHSALSPGTHTASIALSSNGLERTIPVMLILSEAPPEPALQVTPTSLTFVATVGQSAPTAQTLSVTQNGSASAWTATASESWIELTPASGTGSGTFSVRADATGRAPGAYNASVTVNAGALEQVIPVTLQVNEPSDAFQIGRDGLSFANFSYVGGDWEQFKLTFPGTVMELADGTPRRGPLNYFRSSLYQSIGDGGNCAGFTAVSMIRLLEFDEPVEMSLLSSQNQAIDTPFALPAVNQSVVTPGQSDVADYIHLYQARQLSYEFALWWAERGEDTPLAVYQAVKTRTQTNEPVAVDIFGPQGGHRMTAYRTSENGGTGYIHVYDSNWPNDSTRAIEVNLNTGAWTYDLGGGYVWMGEDSGLRFALAALNFPGTLHPGFVNAAQAFAAAGDDNTLLNFEGQVQPLVTDGDGNKVGYENGAPVNTMPGAAFFTSMGFNPNDPDAVGVDVLFLPGGDYTVDIQATASGLYTATAFGNGSALRLNSVEVAADTADQLRIGGSVDDVVFTPSIAAAYCHVITSETNSSSREYESCVDAADGAAVNFALEGGGQGVTIRNQSDKTIGITATALQVGENAGTRTFAATIAPGQSVNVSPDSGGHLFIPTLTR